MKRITQAIYISCLLLLLMTGCLPAGWNVGNEPTRTIQIVESSPIPPAITETILLPTLTVTPTVYVEPTQVPAQATMTINGKEELWNRLHDQKCKLPCLLGVTVGETSSADAKQAINTVNELTQVEKLYEPGDEGIATNFTLHGDGNSYATTYLDVIMKGEKVEHMFVYAEYMWANAVFYDYWQNYSIKAILEQLGKPKEIYFEVYSRNNYGIVLSYPKYGFSAYFTGGFDYANNDLICPVFGKKSNIGISQYNFVNPADISVLFPPTWGMDKGFKNVQYYLGISDDEFIKRIKSEDEACFKVVPGIQ